MNMIKVRIPQLFPVVLLLLCLLLSVSCGSPGKENASSGRDPRSENSETDPSTGRSTGAPDGTTVDPRSENGGADPSTGHSKDEPDGTTVDPRSENSGTASSRSPSAADPDGAPAYAGMAAALSEKYGVEILCGDDAPKTYKDFSAEPEYAPDKILDTLELLDRVLDLYPPGFFPAVCEGYCGAFRICLTGTLSALEESTHMEKAANAFTTVQDNTIWLVLNVREKIRPGTLLHELTHAVDYRLVQTHELPESEWNRLNPPSFSYYNAYLDADGTGYRISGSREYTSLYESDPEQIYFYDPYSKTFGMEDRARLMEKLLENTLDEPDAAPDRCFSSPHVQRKLRFYFYTLRQAFENEDWPQTTAWEAALRQAEAR
ncbi:MAG: hypothetical protein Q4D81_05060 [Eubacteriales bacterium]|nr:hypothetical protein [Eubacteriales bacterium]